MARFRLGFAAALSVGTLAWAQAAFAAGRPLVAEPMEGEKIRVDGDLREWPSKMTDLGEALSGSPGDLKAKGVVGYDEKNLYVVFSVKDKKIARTAAAGAAEDHGSVFIAFPRGRDYVTYEVQLYPGNPGKTPGVVKLKGSAVTGAKLVEAPTDKGYEIESQIPWSAFPEASKTRVGLRATLTFTDADSPGSVQAVIGTNQVREGRGMAPLFLTTEAGLDASLLSPKNLGTTPARELYGNVGGDGMLEHIAVYGSYLTIVGPHFRGGKEFYFGELGVESASMVRKLELHDFDGDGLQEIVIQKRFGGTDKYREVLEVMKVGRDDTPFPAFTHEIGIKTDKGSISNQVKIDGARIEISQGDAEGFEPDTYDEDLAGNMPSALFPWDSVGSRAFAWQGDHFEKGDEKAWEPKVAGKHGPKRKPKKRAVSNEPPPPPPPRPPTQDEMLDRVYALYRKERGVGSARPRFDFVTDVAGDRAPERILIHEKDIVVFGKGFRKGASYAFIQVGVGDPKDILDATARDLTGDGKAEIILHAVMHAKASKALGGGIVDRHALLIYGINGEVLQRVFAAETGRGVGNDRILGAVAFELDRSGLAIELRPSRAIGWTEQSYPFPPDTTTAGGLEPLLLPWGDSPKRRYHWNGSAYVLD